MISSSSACPRSRAADLSLLESPSPSLAGQTVIVNQAVLLAPGHHAAAPSQRCFSISSDVQKCVAAALADTVAGPRRIQKLPASLLSLATPDPIDMKLLSISFDFYQHDYCIIRESYCQSKFSTPVSRDRQHPLEHLNVDLLKEGWHFYTSLSVSNN